MGIRIGFQFPESVATINGASLVIVSIDFQTKTGNPTLFQVGQEKMEQPGKNSLPLKRFFDAYVRQIAKRRLIRIATDHSDNAFPVSANGEIGIIGELSCVRIDVHMRG